MEERGTKKRSMESALCVFLLICSKNKWFHGHSEIPMEATQQVSFFHFVCCSGWLFWVSISNYKEGHVFESWQIDINWIASSVLPHWRQAFWAKKVYGREKNSCNIIINSPLVGGWTNPSEKYARQIGSFPIWMKMMKIKNIWNHHLVKEVSRHVYPANRWEKIRATFFSFSFTYICKCLVVGKNPNIFPQMMICPWFFKSHDWNPYKNHQLKTTKNTVFEQCPKWALQVAPSSTEEEKPCNKTLTSCHGGPKNQL